jgi:ATPase subunit of ABC transporter with duplicated ATPase domains
MHPYLELSDVSINAPGGRRLFDGLNLRIGHEHVALVGRNGVGKSTLLTVLAGIAEADSGSVRTRSTPHFVPQADERAGARSLGELRRQSLTEAQRSGAEILLLDEPTEHLDLAAVAWLRAWLGTWPGCLVVASHDRRLLADFRHFFVLSEAGCRYFNGALSQLEADLEREHDEAERRYVRNLTRLAAEEEHTLRVARRKARKKRAGRSSELDRATPRIRLNQKRDQAQVSHGRLARLREARLASLRDWTRSTRRALSVNLSLELPIPALSPEGEHRVVTMHGVSANARGRLLFDSIDLRLGRGRIGIVGPNGAGKTTLLDILLGRRQPESGSAFRDLSKIGSIEQGGANFMLDESLLVCLTTLGASRADSVKLLSAHKFPLALGDRPLRSLSPGERARAALLCSFARSPAAELLILDEPTFGLDLIGQRALTNALRAWPGGLVIASHDPEFLSEVGLDRVIELGA